MSARTATTSVVPNFGGRGLGKICPVQRPAGGTGAMVTVVVLTVGEAGSVGRVDGVDGLDEVDGAGVVVGAPENRGWRNSIHASR